MLVKVSKPMAEALKKAMPDYSISVVKLNRDQYGCLVDFDLLRNEIDYSPVTELFKAIRVGYPAEFYSNPAYLTTCDLVKIFRHSDKTYDGFINAVVDYLTI